MARVVVVGAGVGGLAAAARLAATGHDVTVCEAAGRVGGKLAGAEVPTEAGRFRFDLGPTLLTLPRVFEDLFAETGDPIGSVLSLRRLDPLLRHRFADGTTVDTSSDAAAQRASFDEAFGPGAGADWDGLLARGEAIWRAVEGPVFGAELSARTLPRLVRETRGVSELRVVAPGRTLRGVGKALLRDPRQRRMLDRYATYEGSDPRRTPAVLAVVPWLEHTTGAWYVEGGVHRLADALADRVAERGGRVRLGSPVGVIETSGGRVSGVRLRDGGRLPADVVIANADARVVYGELLAPRPRRVPPADSLSGFVLLLALRGRSEGLAHHTVLFGGAPYDDEFDAVFGTPARPVTDPVLYLNVADDPAVAPEGHEAMYVLVNAPRHGHDGAPGELDWRAPGRAERYAERLLTLLEQRGVPVRDRVLARSVRTPADLAEATGAPGGAIYGRTLHGPTASFQRPANRSRTRGLFLVGGSTHPGGGLPIVALSARIVAGAVGPA